MMKKTKKDLVVGRDSMLEDFSHGSKWGNKSPSRRPGEILQFKFHLKQKNPPAGRPRDFFIYWFG